LQNLSDLSFALLSSIVSYSVPSDAAFFKSAWSPFGRIRRFMPHVWVFLLDKQRKDRSKKVERKREREKERKAGKKERKNPYKYSTSRSSGAFCASETFFFLLAYFLAAWHLTVNTSQNPTVSLSALSMPFSTSALRNLSWTAL